MQLAGYDTHVWNNSNEVYYVHDVFEKYYLAGAGAKPYYEFQGEPNLKRGQERLR